MTQPTLTSQIGRVESVSNEICIISGLGEVALNNVVEFSSGLKGIVLSFTKDDTQVVALGDYHTIAKGELVRIVADGLRATASLNLLGRVIDPLGAPLDGLGQVEQGGVGRYIESPAKPVSHRAYVDRPLYTGFITIDSQIPIGRGQRELLVGGKKVGKIEVAIEAICHQAAIQSGVISIYVAIDADSAATKRRINRLRQSGALKSTLVIVARSSDPASLNYIAPMVATAMAESLAEQGKDVLLVYDNLTSHAKVYRQISLLLGRPAGREAFPGDIFYLHARLLERCGAFAQSAGGGTITALPIVETQGEEITDYITTNLMSITDGHILFRQSLANKGIQPAIDSGFSVSRISGRAQVPVMRHLSDRLKQLMIEYAEVERYLVFGTELRAEMQDVLDLGNRAKRLFNQTFQQTLSAEVQMFLIYLVLDRHVLVWDDYQMELVRNQITDYLAKPGSANLLTAACQDTDPAKGLQVFAQLAKDFINDPSTIKAAPKAAQSQAEKETIIDLLRGGSQTYAAGEPQK